MDRPVGLLAHPFGDPKGVHNAVAIASRSDLEHLHLKPSLRDRFGGMITALWL
jgi:hypothetical protein